MVDGFEPPLARSDSFRHRATMHNERDPMMREWERRFVNRTTRPRIANAFGVMFERRQHPHAAPTGCGSFEQDPAPTKYKYVFLDQSLRARFGFLNRQRPWIFCAAEFLHGADLAFWFVRQANQCTQIDECGIETCCIAFGDKLRSIFPEFFTTDRRIDRGSHVE